MLEDEGAEGFSQSVKRGSFVREVGEMVAPGPSVKSGFGCERGEILAVLGDLLIKLGADEARGVEGEVGAGRVHVLKLHIAEPPYHRKGIRTSPNHRRDDSGRPASVAPKLRPTPPPMCSGISNGRLSPLACCQTLFSDCTSPQTRSWGLSGSSLRGS